MDNGKPPTALELDRRGEAQRKDTQVVDAIATMLGTTARWDPTAIVEDIANLIGEVRPHPGESGPPDRWAELFMADTGRDVPEWWDNR